MIFQNILLAVIWTILDSYSNFVLLAVSYNSINIYNINIIYGLYSHQPRVLAHQLKSVLNQSNNKNGLKYYLYIEAFQGG